MANISSYIVPINVQAVRILDNDTSKFKGPTVSFSNISNTAKLGVQIDQDLVNSSSPIDEGVHIHWSLPDSLTHGIHDPVSDDIIFPIVPNRWLVTRYFSPEDNSSNCPTASTHGICVKQWIIESNCFINPESAQVPAMVTAIPQLIRVNDNDALHKSVADNSPHAFSQQTVPAVLPSPPSKAPELTYNLFGQQQTYDANWMDNEKNNPSGYDAGLTALSYYGPGFAAYYQNCGTVFGFSDDFKDLGYGQGNLFGPAFSVSYQVIGWYSDAENNDILISMLNKAQQAYADQHETGSKIDFLNQFVETELKWQLYPDHSGAAVDQWPAQVQTIYNGMALDIKWYPATNRAFLPAATEVSNAINLELAIGNNSVEALSALISANKVVSPEGANDAGEPYPSVERHVELLFNAFQQDLLRRLAGTDPGFQIPQLEENLHSLRFAARDGGNNWNVRPAKSSSNNTDAIQLPLPAAELLSRLNAAQQTYDRETINIQSRQQQAYLDWTRWGLGIFASNSVDNTGSDNARQYVETELLQLFTESALQGQLVTTLSRSSSNPTLQFQPVWTAINTTAPVQIAIIANAENQLQYIFPSTLSAILIVAQKSLAAYQAGSKNETLKLLQSINSDQSIQQQLISLQILLTGINNKVIIGITSIISSLTSELTMLNNAASDSSASPGIADVITAYKQSAFAGETMLRSFIQNQQVNLFTGNNIVDTQAIWLYIEAAGFDGLNLTVAGAKLLAAQSAIQQIINGIQTMIQPCFATAQKQTNTQFPALLAQISGIQSAIGVIIKQLLQSRGTMMPDDPVSTSLSDLITVLENNLESDNLNYSCAQSLGAAWQSLVPYLPSAHQVVVYAQVLEEAIDMIDADNIMERSPSGRYWMPHDPVLVMTQPDNSITPLLPVNRNGAADLLPCRQETDLLSALVWSDGSNTKRIDASSLTNTLIPQCYPNLGIKQDAVQQLLLEAYLLAPQAAYDIMVNAAGLDKNTVSILQKMQCQSFTAIASDQVNLAQPPVEKNYSSSLKENDKTFVTTLQGVLPYYSGISLLQDTNPFLPLYMAWKGDFETFQLDNLDSFPADFLSSNFTLGNDSVELLYNTSTPPPLQCSDGKPEIVKLSGQTTLSSRSTDNLLHQVRLYFLNIIGKDISKGQINAGDLSNDFQNDLYATYEYFANKTILSQGLNGFNAGLVQQLQILQTPLNAIDPSDSLTTPLFVFLQQYWSSPFWKKATVSTETATNLFLPIRAGRLRLQEVYIVDAFGRYFQVGTEETAPVQNKLIVAGSMEQISGSPALAAPCAPSDISNNDIYLPPRIIQPARLSFDWLSSNAEEGNDESFEQRNNPSAYSPITGWMLPNHLDDSLVIYDADGSPLGSLAIEGIGRTLTWRSVPSAAQQVNANNGHDQMLKDINAANPLLNSFLTNFAFPSASANSGYFKEFLKMMDACQSTVHTANLQEDKGLAVLIGQPLVLVRAVLRLELMGLPAVAQDSISFMNAVNAFVNASGWQDYTIETRFDAGLSNAALPVQLGDLAQFDDGLVGFFIGDDWTTFYSQAATGSDATIKTPSWGTVQLLPNYDVNEKLLANHLTVRPVGQPQKEMVVTMLMDPRAAVHASTGILPVQSISIPPVQYQHTLQKLMVYFLTTPVLVGNQTYDVPLANQTGYDWLWSQPGQAEIALTLSSSGDKAKFSYSPQQLLDGWLKMKPDKSY